jgi:hypothetical protein
MSARSDYITALRNLMDAGEVGMYDFSVTVRGRYSSGPTELVGECVDIQHKSDRPEKQVAELAVLLGLLRLGYTRRVGELQGEDED